MSKPIRILHFADAHIDMVNHGRYDPEQALPVRVLDFLRSLDTIVDTAVNEKVDLVIFAGDAYKDRNPQPTFQREWGKRIMRLSEAKIPTVLLVGNHDVSPASGRAHTLHEFNTLNVPYIYIGDRIATLTPEQLGVPVQVITLPWVSRSQLMTRQELAGKTQEEVMALIEDRVTELINRHIQKTDPEIPTILTAHVSVNNAKYGSERAVMLGNELVLSHALLNNDRLDYVALGHIHKHQSLNHADSHPPIVYPGSIERIDFGEAGEKKGFVLAEVARGKTTWEFVPLDTRRFIDLAIEPKNADTFMKDLLALLPPPEKVADAICRVKITFPRDWEPLLDETAVYQHFRSAFSIKIQKHRLDEKRTRLGNTVEVAKMTPLELLDTYWRTIGLEPEEAEAMQALAKEVLGEASTAMNNE